MNTHLPALLLLAIAPLAQAASGEPSSIQTEAQFRDLYKELVETNTTLSSGDCTLAAQRMAEHLRQAGFADADLHVFIRRTRKKAGW